MDCGKSTLALQLDHTQSTHGRQGRIFTSRDRSGRARISSRLGLETPATEVDEEFDFWTHVIAQLVAGRRIDYLVCDEAQFYTGERVEPLPIGPLCWCGAKGTHNARTVNGLMVTEGSQVVVGDTGAGEIRYEVLCRAHHRRRMTATRARATLGEDPLPFGE